MNDLPSVINVDFDKTLTDPEADEWKPAFQCEPWPDMITGVRNAYESGSRIIIWTARQWYEAPEVAGWLTANKVPYHGINMGKGGSEIYIDDKSCKPEEFLKMIND